MRNIIATSVILLLGAALTGFAQLPDPYSIAAFNITDAERVELNNFAVKHPRITFGGDTLLAVPSPPPFIRPGQIVMRKKFGADYRLYIGDLDTTAFRAFPPLQSFPLPAWSRLGQAMWYRVYTEPTDNRNLDLDVVFFDNERIYVQRYDTIYYSRDDEWYSIAADGPGIPWGELRVESEPSGAEVYLYGRATGKRTPVTLDKVLAGKYEVEVFLPEYRFQRRSVNVPRGREASVSFQMMSGFDTLMILGEKRHGVLVLPFPPVDSVWRIGDTAVAAGLQIELLEGDYRLVWNGGGLYKDIDTVVAVPPNQMVYFNAPFTRLTGVAAFDLRPEDALLCVEGFPCYPGNAVMELPSGFHAARVSRHGYQAERRKFIVSHGKTSVVKIHLEINADRDGDGFADSLDKCPDEYGLYDGCPKPGFKMMARFKYDELVEYMETEPFSFSVSTVGLISRNPTGARFHNFLASFSGGQLGGLNNYQGLTVGNIYQASYRGFMTQLELGQWLSGVRFRRPDTIRVRTEKDNYLIWYDSLRQIDPAIFFPSTALSAGFKYRLQSYSVGYSLGFQWEEIIIDEIQRASDGEFTSVHFNNNWWFHELMVEADLFTDTFMTPALYLKLKFPFGPTQRVKWHSMHFGLLLRFRPINWKYRI